MPEKIRAAIIGYGRSGRLLHAAGLRCNAAFEVAAICSRSQSSLDQATADFGCPVFTDYRQMLRDVALDLVVIVTRNDQHREMACEALAAGTDILVTKPLATTAAEVGQIADAATASGRTVYPFLPCRWGSDAQRIREIVSAGTIGDVFQMRRSARGFATRDDWQTETRYGGGILLNWGPHLLDTPLYVAGQRATTVFGATSQVLNPGDAEDNFFAHLTLANQQRVLVEWTFIPTGLPDWIVQGTRGCIIVEGRQLKLITGEPAKPADPTNPTAMQGNATEYAEEELGEHVYGDSVEIYRDLARSIRGEAPFRASLYDALHLAEVIDAVKDSQRTQTIITL